MVGLLQGLLFTRLLAAVLIANVLSLAICNVTGIDTGLLPVVFLTLTAAAWLTLRSAFVKPAPRRLTTPMVLWSGVFWLALVLPRLVYVLEWLPNNTVLLTWDDIQRTAGLISMTASEGFPLRHFANQRYLFSYYYAAMIPWASLEILLPLLTLKDVLFLGNAAYYFLILASLLEVLGRLLPTRRAIWVMLFFATVYGGLDWIAGAVLGDGPLIGHHEWWQRRLPLAGDVQVSSSFVAMFWATPHFVAFYCAVLAYAMRQYLLFKPRIAKPVVIGLLLLSGFYSSVFAFLGVVPFLVVEWRYLIKQFTRPAVLGVLLSVFYIPLFMYTDKPGEIAFRLGSVEPMVRSGSELLDLVVSLISSIALGTLVELAMVPAILLALGSQLTRRERRYLAAAWVFHCSTYFVSFHLWNNYAMRGMLLPTFVFFVLFARNIDTLSRARWASAVRRPSVAACLGLLLSFGTVLEGAYTARRAILSMSLAQERLYHTSFVKDLPADYRGLARDRTVSHYDASRDEPLRYYNAEKLLDIGLDAMAPAELEQLTLKGRVDWWRLPWDQATARVTLHAVPRTTGEAAYSDPQ